MTRCTVCDRPVRWRTEVWGYVFNACGYHKGAAEGWAQELAAHEPGTKITRYRMEEVDALA